VEYIWFKLIISLLRQYSVVHSMGALFYSPVDFTDASDLHQSAQV